jgi:hypothetical protein
LPFARSFLAPLIVAPALQRCGYRSLLALLGALAKKNDDGVPILAEVDAIPGTKIDLALEDSRERESSVARFIVTYMLLMSRAW